MGVCIAECKGIVGSLGKGGEECVVMLEEVGEWE